MPSALVLPTYKSQDFYKLILQYCDVKRLSESRTKAYKTLARQLCRFELYQQAIVDSHFALNYDALTTDDLMLSVHLYPGRLS